MPKEGVTITFLHQSKELSGFDWEKYYEVEHHSSGLRFFVQTSIGRTCAFNMMMGVPNSFILKDRTSAKIVEEIREALYNYFHERIGQPIDGPSRPSFKIGELFWCCSSQYKGLTAPHLEHVFDWQSASEKYRPTSMFKFSLHPQVTTDPKEGA